MNICTYIHIYTNIHIYTHHSFHLFTIYIYIVSLRQTLIKLIVQGGNTNKSNSFLNPLHLSRGPLGFWCCKIDSLNQTLIDILKIGMTANEPKKL